MSFVLRLRHQWENAANAADNVKVVMSIVMMMMMIMIKRLWSWKQVVHRADDDDDKIVMMIVMMMMKRFWWWLLWWWWKECDLGNKWCTQQIWKEGHSFGQRCTLCLFVSFCHLSLILVMTLAKIMIRWSRANLSLIMGRALALDNDQIMKVLQLSIWWQIEHANTTGSLRKYS